jgi:flagellar hook-associated protein 3 FlgL
MSYRIASTTQNRQTLMDLQRTQERMAKNYTRITTGNRLTGPGDDPTAAAMILDFGASIQTNTQSIRQADAAYSFLKSSEDAVAGATDAIMRLQELAVNGSSASVPEVDAIRTNMLALANTQSQGKYLFAGTATTTVPFADTAGTVDYNGNPGEVNLSVGANAPTVATNIPGDKVFFGGDKATFQGSSTDIFSTIALLSHGLTNNLPTEVQTAAKNLDAILANLNQVQAELGGRQAGLLDMKDTLTGINVSLQGLQDTQQATDYPTAQTEFSNDQTMQSATLSTLSKMNNNNLFNYLG